MLYDFVPLPKRNPLRWPDGKRLALIVTLNLEYWELLRDTSGPHYAGGPPILPDPLPGNIPDVPNYSWREYGQRVGIWRMFETFDSVGVPASCTVNAKLSLARRVIVDAVLERGWELVAHNYEQGDLLAHYQYKKDEEEALIKAALKVYREVTGKDSKGWLSSALRSTTNTPDILADNGLIYFCDYMNDDQPYMMQTDHGPLVSVPYSIEVNDITLMRRGLATNQVLDLLKEQFDQLYLESETTGKLMNVGLHPYITGQPFRIRAVREFLEYAKGHDHVWWATREEIAEWYMENHEAHIPSGET